MELHVWNFWVGRYRFPATVPTAKGPHTTMTVQRIRFETQCPPQNPMEQHESFEKLLATSMHLTSFRIRVARGPSCSAAEGVSSLSIECLEIHRLPVCPLGFSVGVSAN
jgi:hypothetical protein